MRLAKTHCWYQLFVVLTVINYATGNRAPPPPSCIALLVSRQYYFKGTQAWEFFGLWYWNLYFFVVSYAWMLRFCFKKIFVGPLLGEIGLFCVYWDYAEWKIFCELGKFFFIFQVSNIPSIFANNSFSNIWSINSYGDVFISQNF